MFDEPQVGHVPEFYRGDWERSENPYGPPAQICAGCSDPDQGLLVPVSWCATAMRISQLEDEAYRQTTIWPDAMTVHFP